MHSGRTQSLVPGIQSCMMGAAQARLAPSERSVAARYEALIRVSQAISAHREPRRLFEVLVDELHGVIEFDGIGIAQYDETKDAIEWHVSIDCEEPNPVLSDQCAQKETMTCWVFRNQQPLVIPSVGDEIRFPDTMDFLEKHKMQSVCMLPLTTVHRRIGSMFIASGHPNAYADDEVRFLGLVADQMALAIDDVLNFEASRVAQEQLKLLLALTNSVVSTLDLRELLRSVSGNLRRVMSCDLAGVGVPDPENDKNLRVYALDFPDGKGFVREEVQIPIEGTPPWDGNQDRRTHRRNGQGFMQDDFGCAAHRRGVENGLHPAAGEPWANSRSLASRPPRRKELQPGKHRVSDAGGGPSGYRGGECACVQENCRVEREAHTRKAVS